MKETSKSCLCPIVVYITSKSWPCVAILVAVHQNALVSHLKLYSPQQINYSTLCWYVNIYRTESDHWLVTRWLIHSVLFSTLDWCDPGVWGCQPKTYWSCYCSLNVDAEKRVGHSLVLIWRLKFVHKVNFLFRLWAQCLEFRGDFETKFFWLS